MTVAKVCAKCQALKGGSDFYPSPTSLDGLRSYCKVCYCIDNKAYRKAHPRDLHKQRDYNKAYRKAHPRGPQMGRKSSDTRWETFRDVPLDLSKWSPPPFSWKSKITRVNSYMRAKNLDDTYVKTLLGRHLDVPLELIELKRLTLQIKRALKQGATK